MPPYAAGVQPIAEKTAPATPQCLWISHNFVRVHFPTRQVPAVALGTIEQGLSLAEIFSIPGVWN
jgi:hypothetical protein